MGLAYLAILNTLPALQVRVQFRSMQLIQCNNLCKDTFAETFCINNPESSCWYSTI